MFQVQWLQEALDELTVIWVSADAGLRQAITVATHAIDAQLGTNPYQESESRGDEERVVFVYPLGVTFEVDLSQRIVWVLHVWRFRRRGQ